MNGRTTPPAFTGVGSPDAARELIHTIKANWSVQVELAAVSAAMKRMQFDSLVNAGFTREEALFLIKEPK